MTVHHGGRRSPTRGPRLEKDLPLPPKYNPKEQYPRRAFTVATYSKNSMPSKQAVTAPNFPVLQKVETIKREYNYAATATITVARVDPKTNVRQQAAFPLPPQDKPLPAMPKLDTPETSDSAKSSSDETAPSMTEPEEMGEACGITDDPMTSNLFGNLQMDDTLPPKAMLEQAADLPVLDANGESVPFKSLYWPRTKEEKASKKRVMVIFIRHFYCGVSCRQAIWRPIMS